MKTARYVVAVIVAGAIAWGGWYGFAERKAPSPAAAPNVVVGATTTTPPPPRTQKEKPHAANARVETASRAVDYARSFREAGNYRTFVSSVLPAAQAGDRDAQYYLYAALAYCNETYKFYFRNRDKVLSLKDAIAARSDLPGISMKEDIERSYSRCHEVNEAQGASWGTPEQWLAKATEAGQPVAQIVTAQAIFVRAVTHGSDIPVKLDKSAIAQSTEGDARTLIHAAIESKNPQVIFNMADLQGFLKPDETDAQVTKDSFTWRYVACLRGLDCGADAEWHRQFCLWDPNCLPGESGVDYLRRVAFQMNIFDLETRAAKLSAQIDAEAWSELGIRG